jgi:protein ImuB
MPMRRLLSVWLPCWPTRRLRRRPDGALERPLATVTSVRGVRRLVAVDPLAEAAGLAPEMPLAQARAICPDLALAEADPAADAAGLAALAAWCTRYTPLAATDPPEGLMLDITGCAHLRGGEAALADDLRARLARMGLAAHLAIAGSAAAAWALARAATASCTVLPPGEERAALGALPVALLRLEARDAAGLVRLGVRSIGELARLPRAELAARFGGSVLERLDQAFAAAAEPLLWPHPPTPWRTQKNFAEPIATPDDLAAALRLLAGRLGARLAASSRGGQRFQATFFRIDGTAPTIEVATALPVRDAAYLAKLLTARLETVDPGFGVEAVALAAVEVAPLPPAQVQLGGGEGATRELAASLDALMLRLGEGRVWRPASQPSHVPERSLRRAPPLAAAAEWPEGPPRPLRLLRRPEPVEAVAPVPDDPPLLFRWRGRLHRVRAASGPERIAAEWWRRSAERGSRALADLVRDYYRVEDLAGARFWLFRTGRNAGSPGTKWFVHGLFG